MIVAFSRYFSLGHRLIFNKVPLLCMSTAHSRLDIRCSRRFYGLFSYVEQLSLTCFLSLNKTKQLSLRYLIQRLCNG